MNGPRKRPMLVLPIGALLLAAAMAWFMQGCGITPTPQPTREQPIPTRVYPTPIPQPTREQPTPTRVYPTPTPEQPTPTSTIPIPIESYTLLKEEDLKKAELSWKDEPTAGITFIKLPLKTKIYMPFDGYTAPFFNMAFKADQLSIYDQSRKIEIMLVGYFEVRDIARTPGTLLKKGTEIAILNKKPPKDNVWKFDEPFLIIYAFSDEQPNFSILKQLFPDHLK